MSMPESKYGLLPCPFCGAPARTDLLPHVAGPGWVQCSECECDQFMSDTLDEAVAKWNRRAVMPTPAQSSQVTLALEPFARLGAPDCWRDHPDEFVVCSFRDAQVTIGDLRRAYAAQPPAAPVETEEWEEVTDGTTKEGYRYSYTGNSETGVGQITSHKRRVQRCSAGTDDLIERLRNPMWAHSTAPFLGPQLEQEENLAAMNEAAAEIERLRAVPQPLSVWQPIETAPKSSKDDYKALAFLAWCPDDTAPDGGDQRIVWWEPRMNKGAGCWWGDRDLVESPTHWKPLGTSPLSRPHRSSKICGYSDGCPPDGPVCHLCERLQS